MLLSNRIPIFQLECYSPCILKCQLLASVDEVNDRKLSVWVWSLVALQIYFRICCITRPLQVTAGIFFTGVTCSDLVVATRGLDCSLVRIPALKIPLPPLTWLCQYKILIGEKLPVYIWKALQAFTSGLGLKTYRVWSLSLGNFE